MTRILVILSFVVCEHTFGQLTFVSKKRIQKAIVGQQVFATSFKFTNTGKNTITVSKIKTSCGCILTDLKKRIYLPGESGVIKAELRFAGKRGKIVEDVHVYVLGDVVKKHILTIGSIVPELIRVAPQFLKWKHGEVPNTKYVKINVVHSAPITILSVTGDNSKWRVKLKTIEIGRKYEIAVTPPDTEKDDRTIISIKTDYPKEKPILVRAVGRVMKKEK